MNDMRYLASVVTQCFTAFGELLALHKRFAELTGGVTRRGPALCRHCTCDTCHRGSAFMVLAMCYHLREPATTPPIMCDLGCIERQRRRARAYPAAQMYTLRSQSLTAQCLHRPSGAISDASRGRAAERVHTQFSGSPRSYTQCAAKG